MPRIRSLEDVREFVLEVGICGLFQEKGGEARCLWDEIDLPEEPTETSSKFGPRVDALWNWKNELTADYPDEVFYGKTPKGHVVLMSTEHLRREFYPRNHQTLAACSELAREVYEVVRLEPGIRTAELRRLVVDRTGCTKGRFAGALKQLQTTLNVLRAPDSPIRTDHWLVFRELYPDLVTD